MEDITGRTLEVGQVIVYGYERGEIAEGEIVGLTADTRRFKYNIKVKRPGKSVYGPESFTSYLEPIKTVTLHYPDRTYITSETPQEFWHRIHVRYSRH